MATNPAAELEQETLAPLDPRVPTEFANQTEVDRDPKECARRRNSFTVVEPSVQRGTHGWGGGEGPGTPLFCAGIRYGGRHQREVDYHSNTNLRLCWHMFHK